MATTPAVLRLPRELRNMIYEYTDDFPRQKVLFVKPFTTNETRQKLKICGRCKKACETCQCNRPGLLLVCRQIRDEILNYVFSMNMIHFDDECWIKLARIHDDPGIEYRSHPELRSLWARALDHAHSVSINLPRDKGTRLKAIMSTLPHMPNLRELFLNLPKRNNKWEWLGDFYQLLDGIETLRHVKLGKGFDEQLGQALLDNVLCSAELACGCPGVGKANRDLDYKFPLIETELHRMGGWRPMAMAILGCHVRSGGPGTRLAGASVSSVTKTRQGSAWSNTKDDDKDDDNDGERDRYREDKDDKDDKDDGDEQMIKTK
ncbi:hypothetical protein GCG54_00013840 [Colletotrichum gloeosporioides]|uniref:2EXR domain-containing protein n=1 Tax=Colletotrichum gloeosporioides TaxID=474922 RepID=A0A8H4CUY3_COLGL|nr:uncharacterized protein GCG54_00013840 [Colletotrichum gloeosporioides]KAF3810598.1 hypothetical protein GCG54_00013840 [Colletotrichum gloeosporioides]